MIDQDTGPWPTCEPEGGDAFAEPATASAVRPDQPLVDEQAPPARVWQAIERHLRREGIIQE